MIRLSRYLLFLSFYVFSIRLVTISVDHAPTNYPFLWTLPFLVIAALSWWKPLWSLYGLVGVVPLVSGLQVLGFMHPFPLLSLFFAAIYLGWLPRRILFEKKDILPHTHIGNLIDVLSGIVLFSLLVSFFRFPIQVISFQFWDFFSTGQEELFHGIEAAYVMLQGLFLYRMMELETTGRQEMRRIVPIIYIHASTILLFSLIQLILRSPQPHFGFAISAPFEDIHSYGSYVALLFFTFLNLSSHESIKQRIFNMVCSSVLFSLIILSYSRATWLAVMIIGISLSLQKLSIRKKAGLVLGVLMVVLFFNLVPNVLMKSNEGYLKRLGQLLVIEEYFKGEHVVYLRSVMWKRALNIISDFPMTGSGIGTFYRISPLFQDFDKGQMRNYYENAHNYFLQLSSDLGIPALLIFLGILYFTYKSGIKGLSRDPESAPFIKGLLWGLGAYLITCMTGHPLLLSNQQFLFWFLVASIVMSPGPPYPQRLGLFDNISKKNLTLIVVLALAIAAITLYDSGAWRRGEGKYEAGFYPYEVWDGKKVRWTAKETFSRISPERSLLEFDVYALPFNMGPKGLNFRVFINGRLWDEINFTKQEIRNFKYYIPNAKGESVEIRTVVERTFIPMRAGLNRDLRKLGVGMTEMRFHDKIPGEGVGFYGEERWKQPPTDGWPNSAQQVYRWTGMRASMNIKENVKEGMTLYLRSAHPDIGKKAVKVNLFGENRLLEEVEMRDHQWKKVALSPEKIKDSTVLTFHVNRTWNPRLCGVSEDPRDLGVAVAIPGQ